MRLVDADALKADCQMANDCKDCKTYVRDCQYDRIYTKMDFCGWIDDAPTVDAVPVVRCKDCRFWSKYPGSSAAPQYHECMARMTHIGNLYTTAGEYCSRGERKDGDRNG